MEKNKYQLEVDKNYQWFIEHKEEIIKTHPKKIGHFVLIKNQKIIGFYKTYQDVAIASNKKFKDEPFSIQELQKEEIKHNLGFVGLRLQWER